jgi:hypothetical protein
LSQRPAINPRVAKSTPHKSGGPRRAGKFSPLANPPPTFVGWEIKIFLDINVFIRQYPHDSRTYK